MSDVGRGVETAHMHNWIEQALVVATGQAFEAGLLFAQPEADHNVEPTLVNCVAVERSCP